MTQLTYLKDLINMQTNFHRDERLKTQLFCFLDFLDFSIHAYIFNLHIHRGRISV